MASEEEKKEDSVYDEDGREKLVLSCSYKSYLSRYIQLTL